MKLIEIKHSNAQLKVPLDELVTLSNIINELCYGIDISDTDFAIRVGASHEEASELLHQLLDVIDELEGHRQDDSVLEELSFA
jgi:hypothetical protein